ncbi:MAG TPA: zf-HC2 domain-containing protein [Acidobacteriota bacterium]|nr:zf-HC2 domain-containing protein [Acidobacteriota bacterium]
MNCARLETLLSEYLEDELQEPVRKAAEEHLESCRECRLLVSEMRRMQAEFRAFPEIDPPPGLVQEILRRTSGVPDKRSLWRDLLLPTLQPFLTQRFAFATGIMFVFLSLMVNVLGPGFSGLSADDLSFSSLRQGSARAANQVSSYWSQLEDARRRMWNELSLWAEDVTGRLDYHLVTGLFKNYQDSVREQQEKLRQQEAADPENTPQGENGETSPETNNPPPAQTPEQDR